MVTIKWLGFGTLSTFSISGGGRSCPPGEAKYRGTYQYVMQMMAFRIVLNKKNAFG